MVSRLYAAQKNYLHFCAAQHTLLPTVAVIVVQVMIIRAEAAVWPQ
jgi:hypothetical protein